MKNFVYPLCLFFILFLTACGGGGGGGGGGEGGSSPQLTLKAMDMSGKIVAP